MLQKKKQNEILYLSFNKDKTCLDLGMKKGYRIYELTKKDSLSFYERILGKAIGIIEMLERTNILGLVGDESNEAFDEPNKLNIYDDKESKIIAYITFKKKIKHIRLKKDLILVILENFIYLIDVKEFKQFETIELGYDIQTKTIFSFTLEPEINNLAYNYIDQQNHKIKINTYEKEKRINSLDLKSDYKSKNIILCMEFSSEGKMLAVSAQNYNYLILYRIDDGIPICKCNINSNPVNYSYISFEENNEFLCISLDIGEVYIFNIKSIYEQLDYFNQENKEQIKEEIWSKFYLPEKKTICTFSGDEIGRDHIICVGARGNYYLVKFNNLQKEDLALKINEKYILRAEN